MGYVSIAKFYQQIHKDIKAKLVRKHLVKNISFAVGGVADPG